jgi:hypothetical protein
MLTYMVTPPAELGRAPSVVTFEVNAGVHLSYGTDMELSLLSSHA